MQVDNNLFHLLESRQRREAVVTRGNRIEPLIDATLRLIKNLSHNRNTVKDAGFRNFGLLMVMG